MLAIIANTYFPKNIHVNYHDTPRPVQISSLLFNNPITKNFVSQSLVSMKEERDMLEQKLEDVMSKSKEDHEQLIRDRNELERQFFDYKVKSVSGEAMAIL